jgi:hypothetical protein
VATMHEASSRTFGYKRPILLANWLWGIN